jgi:hypothetical protein
MNDSRNKILLFALGITIGVMAGGAFVYINSVKSGEKNVPDNFIEEVADRVYKLISKEKPEEKGSVTGKWYSKNDSLNSAKFTSDSLSELSHVENLSDSLTSDSTGKLAGHSDEIVVKKDELISVVAVDYIKLEQKASNPNDSLMESLAGIKQTKNSTSFSVEFWQSPINYKGYKATKNKIVLYGLPVGTDLKVYELNDEIYLKHDASLFHIQYTANYKSLEKADASIVALINKK